MPIDTFGASNTAAANKSIGFGSEIVNAAAARRRRQAQRAIVNDPFYAAPSQLVMARARQYLFDVTASPYGAKGDGTHDDTIAIQSAINAAGANGGGIVLFPPGHYLITAPLQVNYSGIIVQGAGITSGDGGSAIYPSANIDCFVGAPYPTAETTGFCVRDLAINYAPASTTGGSAIKIQWADRCWFERLLIGGCFNALTIGQDGVSSPTINEVWFDRIDVRDASGAIIDLHGIGGNVFISNMLATGIKTTSTSYALQYNNSYYDVLWINHIDFESVNGGMNFTCSSASSPGSSLSDFFISDIIVDAADGDSALKFATSGTGNIWRGKIRNFWATGQGGGAGGVTCFLNAQGGGTLQDLNFSGCNFECSTGEAVGVYGAQYVEFNNCKVYGSQRGFHLTSGSNITVQACNNGPYAPTGASVVIEAGMGAFYVHDNDFSNSSVAVALNYASTATNEISRLENNLGYNPVGFLTPPTYTAGVAVTNPFPFPVMVVVSGTVGIVEINGSNTGGTSGNYVVGRGQTIEPTDTGSWTWFGL
ncbi:MAG TPA: glycosyl hydrolase family 28-related protein [Candidatus Rubrimentiphilum sp.]|nr:glycosyl hydrolase family 28-related protein [Candidatus Rubrimentiphilum sp.]